MKKLLVTLLVLGLIGGGGFVAYRSLFVPPEQRACDRLAQLCSSDDGTDKTGAKNTGRCEKAMLKLKETAGDKQLTAASECIDEADSCLKAAGCLFGAGIGAMGEFLKGAKEALDRSLKK